MMNLVRWGLAIVLVCQLSPVRGLNSSGNEFYIPFWFDDPANDSDATILYIATFELSPVTINIDLHIQNQNDVAVMSRNTTIHPSNFTVIPVKEWLPRFLSHAQNRPPNAPNPEWWLVNYIHIKAEENKTVQVHVLNRITNILYTYQSLPVTHDDNRKEWIYYILQKPQDSSTPVIVVISPYNNTDIDIQPIVNSRLQRGLTGDENGDVIEMLFDDTETKISSTTGPKVLVLSPTSTTASSQHAAGEYSYSKTMIKSTSPILVFVGHGIQNSDHGYLVYQQLPPTVEWGNDFVTFLIRKIDWLSSFHHFLHVIVSSYTNFNLYQFKEKNLNSPTGSYKPRQFRNINPGDVVRRLDTTEFKYYIVHANSSMWALEGYRGSTNLALSVVPSVQHYANCYKFPAASRLTDFETVEIKLSIPAVHFQPEQIILDGTSIDEYGIDFQTLYVNNTIQYYIGQYKVDKNYTSRNLSNLHLICHENSTAKFGLLVTGCSCRHNSVYAFPGGFNGHIQKQKQMAPLIADETPSKSMSSSTKISVSIVTSITLATIAVVIAGALLVRSAVKKRRKRKEFRHQKLEGILEMKEPGSANCEYDIFISFADKDREFVEQHLYQPLEQKGYKVCWHHRDFAPGYSIIENIKNSIDKSRRVILVFSEDFHRSEYCLFELRYSCEKMLTTHSQVVVPIVLHEDSFPRELDHITYWKFSVDNPEESELKSLMERLGAPISVSRGDVIAHEEDTEFEESSVLYMYML